MGLRERIARALLTGDVEKAPRLPAGSVTMTETEMSRGGLNAQGYGNVNPLPRNPIIPGVPFGPGNPLSPTAINPVGERGRPDPRRYEYQVAQNINITPTKLVPFATLRSSADQIDILRRCIEVSKQRINGLDWDITLSEAASEKIIRESGGDHVRAMSKARDTLTPEIARLRTFWESPDRANGLTWSDWLNIALEEILVIDAWAVWPQMTVGGDLYGFQILDGSTIKPLLDDRGMRPMPPNPAFQQILYGFPRSEFAATVEDENADGIFSSDELAYLVRNRRTFTVYGFSPVERSLPLADIYLRRQQWIRSEFTDGVLPELMFETDATFGNNAELLRSYENVLNDRLAGITAERKRATVLPNGLKPIQFDGYSEKFNDTIDRYLVESICGHFGVLPSEIGFNPQTGLGGAGVQAGEAESSEVIGLMPLANWISKMVSNLSYTFLGMPRELEFKLMPSQRQNTLANAQRDEILTKGGRKTINESRSEMGLPLLDAPEADLPLLFAPNGLYTLTPNGLALADQGSLGAIGIEDQGLVEDPEKETPEDEERPESTTSGISGGSVEQEEIDEDEDTEKAAEKKELEIFLKWAAKGVRNRPFNFEEVDPIVGEALNRLMADGDIETARTVIAAYTS